MTDEFHSLMAKKHREEQMNNRDKIPPRKGYIATQLPKDVQEVKAVQKLGGYWYTDRKFPFVHFEPEKLLIFTNKQILEYKEL